MGVVAPIGIVEFESPLEDPGDEVDGEEVGPYSPREPENVEGGTAT